MPRLSDDDNELARRGRADIRQSIQNHDATRPSLSVSRKRGSSDSQLNRRPHFRRVGDAGQNIVQEIQDKWVDDVTFELLVARRKTTCYDGG